MSRVLSQALPNTQKSLVCSARGRWLKEAPVPMPEEGEILLSNEVAASNPKDWKYPLWMKGYEFVEGSDAAGTIAGIGKDVNGFNLGDRIAGFARMLSREDRNGCYAQYTVFPTNTIFKIPEKMSFEEAATFPLAFLTTALAMFKSEHLGLPNPAKGESGNETVVINGASSSIGSFAVQLAKLAKLRVVGIAGSGGQYAKECGADVVIDYRNRKPEDLAKEIQQHGPSSHVYDCVSTPETQDFLAESLQPKGGKIASVLPIKEGKADAFKEKNVQISQVMVATAHKGDAAFSKEFLDWAVKRMSDGTLHGNKFRVVPRGLEGISDALDELQANKVSAEKLVYRIQETPGL